MGGRSPVKEKGPRRTSGSNRRKTRDEVIRMRRRQPVAQQVAASLPEMTEGDMVVSRFVAADESLRNLREGSERLNRELEEGRLTSWPNAAPVAAQYVDNPDNLMVVQAEPHYAMIDDDNRDVGMQYSQNQVMGQVIMDGNVPARGNGQDQVVMAIPHAGSRATKRRKSKKRKSKRRKSKKKMRRTKKI